MSVSIPLAAVFKETRTNSLKAKTDTLRAVVVTALETAFTDGEKDSTTIPVTGHEVLVVTTIVSELKASGYSASYRPSDNTLIVSL